MGSDKCHHAPRTHFQRTEAVHKSDSYKTKSARRHSIRATLICILVSPKRFHHFRVPAEVQTGGFERLIGKCVPKFQPVTQGDTTPVCLRTNTNPKKKIGRSRSCFSDFFPNTDKRNSAIKEGRRLFIDDSKLPGHKCTVRWFASVSKHIHSIRSKRAPQTKAYKECPASQKCFGRWQTKHRR